MFNLLKFTRTLSLVLVLSILMSFSLCYADTDSKVKEPKLMNTNALKVGEDTVQVREYNDNGKIVTTYSGEVKDKSKVEAYISNSLANSSVSTLAAPEGWSPERYFNVSGVSAVNANAKVIETIYFKAYGLIFDFRELTYGGVTSGYWLASSPANATKIILRQKYTIGGLGISIGWPPGFGISPSQTSYEWVSSDYNNLWYCTAPHENITVSATTASMSIIVADGADVYIGSTCYKARTEVGQGWHQVYYGY